MAFPDSLYAKLDRVATPPLAVDPPISDGGDAMAPAH